MPPEILVLFHYVGASSRIDVKMRPHLCTTTHRVARNVIQTLYLYSSRKVYTLRTNYLPKERASLHIKGKGKTIPVQAYYRRRGFQDSRQQAHEGGRLSALNNRPPLPPWN